MPRVRRGAHVRASEAAHAPVDVLQTPAAVVRHLHAQQSAEFLIPRRRHIRRLQRAVEPEAVKPQPEPALPPKLAEEQA